MTTWKIFQIKYNYVIYLCSDFLHINKKKANPQRKIGKENELIIHGKQNKWLINTKKLSVSN